MRGFKKKIFLLNISDVNVINTFFIHFVYNLSKKFVSNLRGVLYDFTINFEGLHWKIKIRLRPLLSGEPLRKFMYDPW